jgi:hypothetical protein
MKKLLLSISLMVLVSSQSILAAGYIATYSVNVSNPAEYAKQMDSLMNSEWGKSFPGVVTLGSYAFNGYDDATHAVVINYDNEVDVGKATESFYTPRFAEFLAATASIAEPVEQSLNRKILTGGEMSSNKNNVYTIYRMDVKNPVAYAKSYAKVAKAQVEAGNIGGAYGLRAQVAGNQNYYTHYAFTGSDSIGAALAEQETLFSSDSFAQFQKEISSNRSVIQTSMLVVMVRYNDEN